MGGSPQNGDGADDALEMSDDAVRQPLRFARPRREAREGAKRSLEASGGNGGRFEMHEPSLRSRGSGADKAGAIPPPHRHPGGPDGGLFAKSVGLIRRRPRLGHRSDAGPALESDR